jgi:glycosyltransferase involved in cell wall biosynthesis
MGKKPDIKITFCMTSFNRKEESIINIRRIAPHVDRTIIIDGGSWDGSIEWFNSQECKDLNVECYVHPWIDNPPEQRNKYLDLITDGWVLVLDCDELLEIPALYKLKYIAQEAENKGCDGVAFLAHDIQIELEGGIYDSLSNYYNRMFFKASPGMKYIGHTHVALYRPHAKDRCLKTNYQYYHIKPWADVFFRACRNYWTTCAVADNRNDDPGWIEFKKMTKDAGFQYFYQFAEYMKKGNIDPVFKDWFIRHKDDENPEARSWFVSYFMFLNPQENVDHLENKDLKFSIEQKPVRLTA